MTSRLRRVRAQWRLLRGSVAVRVAVPMVIVVLASAAARHSPVIGTDVAASHVLV